MRGVPPRVHPSVTRKPVKGNEIVFLEFALFLNNLFKLGSVRPFRPLDPSTLWACGWSGAFSQNTLQALYNIQCMRLEAG